MNPLKWFEISTRDMSGSAKRRFYCDNYVDLVGSGAGAELQLAA